MPRTSVSSALSAAFSVAALAAASLVASASSPAPLGARQTTSPDGPPPVTVLVVVDQLRADLLDRYDEVFTGGFRRLRDAGWRFTRTTHEHALTLTAPGHATLSTGTFPSHHGVVSNAWIEDGPAGRRVVENVVDATVPVAGAPNVPGAAPTPLLRSTLGEWLQDAHPDARVLSVSAKSRAAVLLAGRADAGVYWFDERLGAFVTSVHYADASPEWLRDFNANRLPELHRDSVWALDVPPAARSLARGDTAAWEGDGVHTAFPHAFRDAPEAWGDDFWGWWATTPHLDHATRLLVQAGIEAEGIGDDDVPDLVTVSFSQTDRVGHAYGPRSLEQLDNLLRLDRELGTFLDWLDARFGPDGYLLALTADHGVADAPEQAALDGLPAFRITTDSALVLQNLLNDIADDVGMDPAVLSGALAAGVPRISWIEQAWTFAELLENGAGEAAADSFTVLQARSAYPGRLTGVLGGQGVEMRMSPWTLGWSYPRGTTHGTPYLYDRHVPFVLFGAGVRAGASDEPVATADVAPTLAALLGLVAPNDLDGRARTIR